MTLGSKVRARLDASIFGKIDAYAVHPDGSTLYRVKDHWFEESYLELV